MWFALTVHPVTRSRRESKKEFLTVSYEVFLTAGSKSELETMISGSLHKYPEYAEKYLKAGIKIVEAETAAGAKRKARKTNVYFDDSGQYRFF